MTAGLREQLRRARPSVSSPTYLLLLGKITDAEYRQMLVAQSQRWGIPRRGWTHRPARIRSFAILVATYGGSILVLLFLLIACSLAGPVPQ